MRALEQHEIAATLQAFRGRERLRDRALFLLGICLGFRISELLSLKIEDIRGALSDAPEAQIAVKRKSMKGKRKGRAVWVHSEARGALALYIAAREKHSGRAALDSEYVFASGRRQGAVPMAHGKPYSRPICRKWAWKMLRRTIRRAGIYDATAGGTHTMRKTFAQEIYVASGKDLYVTQKALDHASPSTTARYLNSVDADVKSLILNRKIA